MSETDNMYLRMDLSKVNQHAYQDCFGTSEEKYLVRYIESIYPKLSEKYNDVYLLRNEKDLKIYSFTSGDAYQPDYVLFLNKKDSLKEIREKADIHFSTQNTNFNVWGMPFFTQSKRQIFETEMKQSLDI